MGSSCTRGSANNSVVDPPSVADQQVSDHLSAYLSLDNPYNINHKYSHFCILLRDKIAGQGYRKTSAYNTILTQAELTKKRREFWDTRVQGDPLAWKAIEAACDSDEGDGLAILGTSGLKLVGRSMQMAYDARGNTYDIPIFCINEPLNYEFNKKANVQIDSIPAAKLKFKMRCTQIHGDVAVEIDNKIMVRDLKDLFLKRSKLEDLTTYNIRIFLFGQEMQDCNYLAEYSIPPNFVLTVFIRKTNTNPPGNNNGISK